MRRPRTFSWVGLALILVLIYPLKALAINPPALAVPPGLSFAEIKVTGNEFLMMQNNTGAAITDLSVYWLYGFNNSSPLTSGVSSSTQQLPQTSLAAGQTIFLSSNGGATCGAAVTAKLSLSLTDSMGYLEVVQQSLNSSGVLIQTAGDAVSWGSSTSQPSGQLGTVPSSSSAPNAAYYRYQNTPGPPSYLWQRADTDGTNPCQMNVAATPADTSTNVNQLLTAAPPPAVILSTVAVGSNSAGLPVSDIGLSAPTLNELLPNPNGTGTDSTDEFIEFYNSNDAVFDLSGFKLEIGLSTKHDYIFPAGTTIDSKSFKAFYSADTGLSLSNSGGQAWLIDPMGNVISQSDGYSSAKDGQAWALANGVWYWTTNPTPNAENIINGTAASKVKAANTGSATQSASASGTNSSSFAPPTAAPPTTPLHPWTLAGVGSAALLYAGYEYRNDLAGHVYRLRRYAEARRATRK